MLQFCEVASQHLELIMYWSVFRLNKMMQDNIIENTKGVEQVYFENNAIAHHLLDTKESLKKKSVASSGFNTSENAKHSMNIIGGLSEYDLKKAITTYESVKDSIDQKKFAGFSIKKNLEASIPSS